MDTRLWAPGYRYPGTQPCLLGQPCLPGPTGHRQIRADKRPFPGETTFEAKLQAASEPAADKARYVPFFRFGPEEKAFSRSESSRI